MQTKVHPIKAIALGFIVLISIGTILLMLPASSSEGKSTGFADALFTATSATTVTGLTVVGTQNHFSPFGHLVILALIQIGGLGYMTVMSFIFIFGRNLRLSGGVYLQESMSLPSIGEIYKFARNTAAYVFLLEMLGAIALFLSWKGSADVEALAKYAVFHSISAFNNAGFDLFSSFSNAANFGSLLTIAALTVLGGIGFVVINELHTKLRNRHQKLSLQTKVVLTATILLLVIGAAGIFAFESGKELEGASMKERIGTSLFQSVTARTAGFSLIDYGAASAATMMLVSMLMFIGASPGGTGGGIKTTTFAAAAMTFISFVRGRRDTEIYGRRLSQESVAKAFAAISIAFALIAAASMAISAIEPQSFEKILFETISAFSTTGLTTGITPMLGTASKLTLIGLMFIGRIGPLGLLLMLLEKRKIRRLPEEDVFVG